MERKYLIIIFNRVYLAYLWICKDYVYQVNDCSFSNFSKQKILQMNDFGNLKSRFYSIIILLIERIIYWYEEILQF